MLPQCHVNVFAKYSNSSTSWGWRKVTLPPLVSFQMGDAKFANKMVPPLHPCRKTLRRANTSPLGLLQKWDVEFAN